ncbi:hypothetical protein MTP99_013479 [Tenebrio molitor]|jgi:hypothetical protein|nr:hypothetical protein MTP99_013479 [Tenebrio molitor]
MSGNHQNITIKLCLDASRLRHKSSALSRDPGILLAGRVCGFPMDLPYAKGLHGAHIRQPVIPADKSGGFRGEKAAPLDVFTSNKAGHHSILIEQSPR